MQNTLVLCCVVGKHTTYQCRLCASWLPFKKKVSDHYDFRISCPGSFLLGTFRGPCCSLSHTGVMRDLIILQHQEEPLNTSTLAHVTVRVEQLLDDFYPFGTFVVGG